MQPGKSSSEIILDSYVGNSRITCYRITFPRIVNSELLRHRSFSFCSASSRAIPIDRVIDQYCNYVPERWSKHQPGMQPMEPEFNGDFVDHSNKIWKDAMDHSINSARQLLAIGASKEQVNRLLEPFSYITVIVQGDYRGFKNFFDLRCDSTAQFEIKQIADMMKEQYDSSIPVKRNAHLPFVDIQDFSDIKVLKDAVMQCVARSARTSYYNFEGKPSAIKKDRILYDKLIKARPPHLSPSEFAVFERNFAIEQFENILHVAPSSITHRHILQTIDLSGNLHSPYDIVQYRKILEQNRNII